MPQADDMHTSPALSETEAAPDALEAIGDIVFDMEDLLARVCVSRRR